MNCTESSLVYSCCQECQVTASEAICSKCTFSFLPYNNVDVPTPIDLSHLNNINFNTIDIDLEDDSVINSLNDIDPDLCYYNQYTSNLSSEYYSLKSFNKLCNPLHHSPFSIIHTNIRSFNRNALEFNSLLSSIDHQFSLICLSETWLNESNCQLAQWNNYKHEFIR